MGKSQVRISGSSSPDGKAGPAKDRSLMERIHSGDPTALDAVLDRYWHALVAYAGRLLSDRDGAEDVVQEAMVLLWEERARWTPSQQLRGFLYRITRNLALNERKRKQVRRDWAESRGRSPERTVPTPLDLAERSELRTLLERAIRELPPRRREVFILARYHGHTYRDIAEIMEVSPQTVANQMSSALDDLRATLRPQIAAHLAHGQLQLVRDGDVKDTVRTGRPSGPHPE